MNAVGHILTTGKKEGEMAYSELIKNFEKIRSYSVNSMYSASRAETGTTGKAHARMTMNAAG